MIIKAILYTSLHMGALFIRERYKQPIYRL